jgi:5-methylcytosine-specific restriction endonuclease McrA
MRKNFDHDNIWNDPERIKKAVEQSTSTRNTLVNLGIEPSSKRYHKLRKQCDLFDINLDFANPRTSNRKIADEFVFTNPSAFTRNNGAELKRRALSLGYITQNCTLCGIPPEWNGLPLSLQLDHIDGNYRNNLPENLRMLCPNCHTQTDTYGPKNGDKEYCKNGHPWVEENLTIHSTGYKRCKVCANHHRAKARKKEREERGWAP